MPLVVKEVLTSDLTLENAIHASAPKAYTSRDADTQKNAWISLFHQVRRFYLGSRNVPYRNRILLVGRKNTDSGGQVNIYRLQSTTFLSRAIPAAFSAIATVDQWYDSVVNGSTRYPGRVFLLMTQTSRGVVSYPEIARMAQWPPTTAQAGTWFHSDQRGCLNLNPTFLNHVET